LRSYARKSLATNLGQLAQGQIDKLAVLTIGREALGVYAVGSVIGNAVTPLYLATGSDRFRDRSRHATQKSAYRLITIWLGACSCGLAALAAVPLFYGRAFSSAGPVALILSIGSIGFGVFLVERAVMDRAGRPGASSVVTVAHVVAMLLILPLVTRSFGVVGAAAASAILQLGRAMLAIIVARRVAGSE
jgi:O-antigen/teichoic acid export membrane protein